MDCMTESIDPGKHKRPSSPFGMSETASGSSYSSGGGRSSEEEEDMANCLIMLAQSVSPAKEDKSDLCYQKTEKLKNRRSSETTAGGKSDLHNYECKTCNRAFPSFQALGGHRASHKKPKLSVEDANSVSIKSEISEEDRLELLIEYEENKIVTIKNKPPSPPPGSIQTGYRFCNRKIHECSICGSKFLSGQALGGHMRRHRPAPLSINQMAVSTNTDDTSNIAGKSRVLSLDLNLPAPEVDDDVLLNFQFAGSSSQQSHVFSGPALVDCHY